MRRAHYRNFSNLDRAKVQEWLLNSGICDKEGNVYSWINPKKPGYVYEEIMGYYTHLMAILFDITRDQKFLARAEKTADALIKRAGKNAGASRNGITYTFDTALCVSGFVRLYELNKDPKLLKIIKEWTKNVVKNLEEGKAIVGGETKDHWSTIIGASNIKSTTALFRVGTLLNDESLKFKAFEIAHQLTKKTFRDSAFHMHEDADEIYTHAHCYALEGLSFLTQHGYHFKDEISEGADWLALHQNDDGSVFNWYKAKPEREKLKVADATVQSLRVWLLTNRKKYTKNIEKAYQYINSIIKDGGLPYHNASEDINAWATMFLLETFLYDEDLLSAVELV